MKRTLSGQLGASLLLAAAAAALLAGPGPERPDFSGTWILDFERSQIQIKARIDSGIFTIDHREPDFRFSRTFMADGKEDGLSYALTTDGKVKVEELPDRTRRSRLYWDGATLVYDARTVLKNGREATNVVRYSLRDGGRTFVAEEQFRGPVLKYDNLWVAERKSRLPLPSGRAHVLDASQALLYTPLR